MREYDGIEKRYRKSDLDLDKNIELVEDLLGFCPDVEQLDFDLSFYSGGIGVYDKLAISCLHSSNGLLLTKEKYNLMTPEEAIKDLIWAEDFEWLVKGDNDDADYLVSTVNFINDNKAEFQDVCLQDSKIYFSYESNVNHWAVVWLVGERLNFAYFDQG